MELRWRGKFIVSGLFDGEHFFGLKENTDGSTLFVHGKDFSGLLVGFFGKALEKTRKGSILMNEALKKRCEAYRT